MKRLTTVAAVLTLGVTIAACGGGDQEARQADTATKEEPQVEVSDSELKSFVEASMRLEDFSSEMRQRMSEAEGQEEGRKVREQLMQQRDSIIRAAGLDGTERYDAIMEAIKSNEQIRNRYMALRNQMESETTASSDTAS